MKVQSKTALEEALCVAPKEKHTLKDDVEAKSLFLTTVEQEVDEKLNVLADLEVVPTLSPDHVIDLTRHEQAMLEIQSSLNLDAWMDTH